MPFRERPDFKLKDLPDEELIEYVVAARDAGHAEAMKQGLAIFTFGRYNDLVRRARTKVPARDAEDIASQTISDAVMSRFEGVSVGEFMKLVSRILQRRIADYYDKRERSPDTQPLPEENQSDDDVHSKPTAISSDESTRIGVQDIVDRVLDGMSPEHRRVIERFVLEDLDAETAARRVNEEFPNLTPPMSIDNVHKIASRFRKDLRGDLEESG